MFSGLGPVNAARTLAVSQAKGRAGSVFFLLSVSHLQEVFYLWRPGLPDPDDDLILELAVAAGCR